jgi:hypothetical protein
LAAGPAAPDQSAEKLSNRISLADFGEDEQPPSPGRTGGSGLGPDKRVELISGYGSHDEQDAREHELDHKRNVRRRIVKM